MRFIVGILGSNREERLNIASRLARELSKMGYIVMFITQGLIGTCEKQGPLIEVSLNDVTIIRVKRRLSLDHLQALLPANWCIVIAEGIKGKSNIIVASEDRDLELYDENCIAIIPLKEELKERVKPPLRVLSINEVVEEVLKLALKNIVNYLAQENCGECGYSNCLELAKAVLKGLESPYKCVKRLLPVKLRVNDIDIPLNPFTAKMIAETLKGLVSILKGVPKDMKRIDVNINYD